MKEMTSEDGYFYCTHISLGDRDEIIEDFKSRDDAKGIGIKIFREFMIPIIKEVAKSIGVKIIYIFSIPKDKVISNYYKYDFRRLEDKFEKDLHKRIKPGYDKDCIFMYQVLN